MEELCILKLKPVHQINVTSKEYSLSDVDLEDLNYSNIVETVELDHDYLPDPVSPYSKNIISYIAGYVVHYLKKQLICDECVQSLVSDTKDLFLFSFINVKNKNGLQYPSEDVLQVCMTAEKLLKNKIYVSAFNTFSLKKLSVLILKKFVFSKVFDNLVVHSLDQSVLDNHRTLLMKSVIERYLNIRMAYLTKNKPNKPISDRHQSNKLTLFKGQ